MKKNKLLLPIIGLSLSVPMVLPLVSCNKDIDNGPLCFTADGEVSTISYDSHGLSIGDEENIDIEVSTDMTNWDNWELQSGTSQGEVLTIQNGQKLYVRNTKNTLSTSSSENYFQFIMTGKIKASGNVDSMINYGGLTHHCYSNLFLKCESLTRPPKLPSTTLPQACYYSMFHGCKNLTTTPELPATVLDLYCYQNMFFDCLKLHISESEPTKCSEKGLVFNYPIGQTEKACLDMFYNTAGSFKGKPTPGHTYYWYK